jgi:phage terminase large subunit-like protein
LPDDRQRPRQRAAALLVRRPEGADLEDEKIWRAVNPAGWLKTAELRRQLHDAGLGELEFRRLHLNQWTKTREAWLPAGCWNGLRSDARIPEGAPIYVGVDAAIHHDTTAVCWAHRLEDGRILLRAHVWAAATDAVAHQHVPGGAISLAAVEEFIRDLARRYQVREVAYDPHYFQRSAELLDQHGLTMVEFLQASGPMADAYQGFYQLAREGRLAHDGDPVLAAHIEATAARKSERGWKLSKLTNNRRIDAAIAAVLAVARAQHEQPKQPPTSTGSIYDPLNDHERTRPGRAEQAPRATHIRPTGARPNHRRTQTSNAPVLRRASRLDQPLRASA